MQFSRYNIFSKIRDSENYFIINLLSGNADILTRTDALKVETLRNGGEWKDDEFHRELLEKGYLTDISQEKKEFRKRYLDFLDSRENDEVQLFFVPNYTCNFACSYCYQDQYTNQKSDLKSEVVDAFFRYVEQEFQGRKKYVTIFGGEPLLSSPRQKEIIEYIIRKASLSGIELCFVTNGYSLEEYLPLLLKGKIREIQVTLDGTKGIHDKRRFLKGGGETFDRITRGIDQCLQNQIDINLRMVIDKDNINNLPDLAQFAIDKGWTTNSHFKTQIGRNYELHHCQSSPDRLFDRISLFESIHDLIKLNPHITEFHKPAYSVSKYLFENGELPDPLFDSCPACKTEWAFDYTGNIYSCTATVGKLEESLGTFYPEKAPDKIKISQWESRDVTSIKECNVCNLQLACGGGCGSVAKNRNGSICSPDCRPVKELIELGFSAYFENNNS
jgi:uncharacterized protein